MASISFDPAADFYDETRGFPQEVALRVAQAIEISAGATPQTAFLEVGVGTGRIALPVAARGFAYTGVDISENMLERLVRKVQLAGWGRSMEGWGMLEDEDAARAIDVQRFREPEGSALLRLVASDITSLPFKEASFDAVVAVHIFHLVEDWQQTLKEIERVLRPGGKLLRCWDTYTKGGVTQLINDEWRAIVLALGGEMSRPGAAEHEVSRWIRERGYAAAEQQVCNWEQSILPRRAIEYVAQRYWSSSWRIPDDIFNKSIEHLWDWAKDYYGVDLDREQRQQRSFYINTTQF